MIPIDQSQPGKSFSHCLPEAKFRHIQFSGFLLPFSFFHQQDNFGIVLIAHPFTAPLATGPCENRAYLELQSCRRRLVLIQELARAMIRARRACAMDWRSIGMRAYDWLDRAREDFCHRCLQGGAESSTVQVVSTRQLSGKDTASTPKLYSTLFVQCLHKGIDGGLVSLRKVQDILDKDLDDLEAVFREHNLNPPFELK